MDQVHQLGEELAQQKRSFEERLRSEKSLLLGEVEELKLKEERMERDLSSKVEVMIQSITSSLENEWNMQLSKDIASIF